MAIDATVYTKDVKDVLVPELHKRIYVVREANKNLSNKDKLKADFKELEIATKNLYKDIFNCNFSGNDIADWDKQLTDLLNDQDILKPFLNQNAAKIWKEWQEIEDVSLPDTVAKDFITAVSDSVEKLEQEEFLTELENFFGTGKIKRIRFFSRGTTKGGYEKSNDIFSMVRDLVEGFSLAFQTQINSFLEGKIDSYTTKINQLLDSLKKKTINDRKTTYIKHNFKDAKTTKKYVQILTKNIAGLATVRKEMFQEKVDNYTAKVGTIETKIEYNESNEQDLLKEMREEFIKRSLCNANSLIERDKLDEAFKIFGLSINSSKNHFIGDIGEIGVIYRLLTILKPKYVDSIKGMPTATTPGIDILLDIGAGVGIQVKNYNPDQLVPRTFRQFTLEGENVNELIGNSFKTKASIQAAVDLMAAARFNVQYNSIKVQNKRSERAPHVPGRRNRLSYFYSAPNSFFVSTQNQINAAAAIAERYLQRFFPEAMSIQTIESGLTPDKAALIFIVAGKVISAAQILQRAVEETLLSPSSLTSGVLTVDTSRIDIIPEYLNKLRSRNQLKDWPTTEVFKNGVVLSGSYDFSNFFKI